MRGALVLVHLFGPSKLVYLIVWRVQRAVKGGGGGEEVDDFLENDWLIFFRTAIMKFLSSTENRDDHTYHPYT